MPDVRGENALFLPQKPYLPIDTLRNVLRYPLTDNGSNDPVLGALLAEVGLPKLSNELGVICDWSKRLSLGEQQRLSIVRAILKKPDWLFLDEALASLDQDSQNQALTAMKNALPTTTVVAISHQEFPHTDSIEF